MKWKIEEIQKQKEITFDENLLLKANLMQRNPEILDISEIEVKGSVQYDAPLYFLAARVSCIITLPSSRSLTPVELPLEFDISESYKLASQEDEEDSDFLSLESDEISLDEAVSDNILLEIPLRVLSEEEKQSEDLPRGKFWQVMSEEEYEKLKEEKKKEQSPFSGLNSLFDEKNSSNETND